MVFPLCNTSPGQTVSIVCLYNDALMAGRLCDLGFEPGETVSCVLKKPKNTIAAYLVRNSVIALRREDSCLIMVKTPEPSGDPV